MIFSMTGYGRGEAADDYCRVRVELRCVNNRFLDVQLRVPRNLAPLEGDLRRWIGERFHRGRLEAGVSYQIFKHNPEAIHLDQTLAVAYRNALEKLAGELGYAERPSFELVTKQVGVLELADAPDEFEKLKPLLQRAFTAAAEKALAMKAEEGEALKRDLLAGVAALRRLREELRAVAPAVQQEVLERFRQRTTQLAGELALDAARLHQEAAILLSKMDVNEELVRLGSHLDQLEQALAGEGSIGKRLDFLAQEMHREISTLGNKIQDTAITRLVVEVKTTIEQIREQVQNVE